MLIVVIMGKWSDDSVCLSCSRCPVVNHRGDDVCCRVVYGTLVGVFVFSIMWSELLMTSAISCPLWSSVYECPLFFGAWMWCLQEVYRCLLL